MSYAMAKRHKVRELAMQVLFLWDALGQDDADAARQALADGTPDAEVREAALVAAAGTWAQREMIDQRVERFAPQWPTRRQPQVDRNCIRLAVWELTNSQTPPKVVLDEAIELVKEYSTEQSAAFVNGVLDAVLKEHQALLAMPPAPVEPGAAPSAESAPTANNESMTKPE